MSLDVTLNEQVVWINRVDKKFDNVDITDVITRLLGEVQHIKKIEYRFDNSYRVVTKVTCSNVEFNNCWSIQIKDSRAKGLKKTFSCRSSDQKIC